MSRHRNVRNLDDDEYEDEWDSYGSSYGSSYQDETSLSTSVEKQYMYNRNRSPSGGSGHTPKMGHFFARRSDSISSVPEEDEGLPPRPRARTDSETSSGSSDNNEMSKLSPEDEAKMASCLEFILDVMGDTLPEQVVREAVVRCDFDSEVALNTLLNNPVRSKGGAGKLSATARSPPPASRPETDGACALPTASIPISTGKSSTKRVIPEVVTTGATANLQGTGAISKRVQPVVATNGPKNNHLQKATGGGARSRSQSPAVNKKNQQLSTPSRDSAVSVSTPSSTYKPVPMRKATINPTEAFKKERGEEKDALNLVVVGHVDSGKSTLMGHLLYSIGQVSQKIMHKYEQESKKLGKLSFAYAWVLDESSEERERGITMDVGHNKFETKSKSVTLLDAPGHKDFIPNMISGAYQADVAVLVVNAARGEFEAGFDFGGQTREHALLVRSLGVNQLCVAVNKLDTENWSEARFHEISAILKNFLKQVGFKDADVTYVPCSGFTGDNLNSRSENLTSWYKGPCLLEVIDQFRPPTRPVEKPFRMSISDIYKQELSMAGVAAAGRIESGFVQKNDQVVLMPAQEVALVKAVLRDDTPTPAAFAGDHATLVLSGIDVNKLSTGMVACDPAQPIAITRRIKAKLVVFHIDVPITKGYTAVLHYGSVTTQAVVKKLIATINRSNGEIQKAKPRCLTKNCSAEVEIKMDAAICMELYANVRELGRFMLRNGGKTIAAGLVTEIFDK